MFFHGLGIRTRVRIPRPLKELRYPDFMESQSGGLDNRTSPDTETPVYSKLYRSVEGLPTLIGYAKTNLLT